MTLPLRRLGALGALLSVGWLASPHPVPLYDGVGFPDEPYRYVSAPANTPTTKPPSTATLKVVFSHQQNPEDLEIATEEQGPQAAVYLAAHSVTGATTSTLTLAPQDPKGFGGTGIALGNAYVVSFEPSVTLKELSTALIILRSPQPLPSATMWYLPTNTTTWQPLSTTRSGLDIFNGKFTGPGTYVLSVKSLPSSSSSSGSNTLVWVVLLASVAVVALVVVATRVRAKP